MPSVPSSSRSASRWPAREKSPRRREGDGPGAVDGLGTLLGLQRVDPQLQLLGRVLEHEPLRAAFLLVAGVVGQLRPQAHEFVGEQARLRITHDRGDRRGLSGDLGLGTLLGSVVGGALLMAMPIVLLKLRDRPYFRQS